MAFTTGAVVRQQLGTPVAGLATPDKTSSRSMLSLPLILQPSICGQTTGSAQKNPLAKSGSRPTLPTGLSFRSLLSWRNLARWALTIVQKEHSCSQICGFFVVQARSPVCAAQGVGGELAKGETAAQRLGWYKEVYNLVEQQLQSKR